MTEVDNGVLPNVGVVVVPIDVVVDVGCGCGSCDGSLLSWKLVVVLSHSLSMSVLTVAR